KKKKYSPGVFTYTSLKHLPRAAGNKSTTVARTVMLSHQMSCALTIEFAVLFSSTFAFYHLTHRVMPFRHASLCSILP
ncbi:hypothetical protein, partial [Paraburkholderia sp. Ac-20347]|uniref:hypothetical protein n=1 Tax=Paraburkholderia sp. Ac-20347 TaxID=2703892 RepID=UPI00197F1561